MLRSTTARAAPSASTNPFHSRVYEYRGTGRPFTSIGVLFDGTSASHAFAEAQVPGSGALGQVHRVIRGRVRLEQASRARFSIGVPQPETSIALCPQRR